MKSIKIIGIIIGVFQFSLTTYGQITLPPPKTGTKTPIEISEINIKKINGSGLVIHYGESAVKLLQALGEPDSAQPFLMEMDEIVGTLYKYGINTFLLKENALYLFTIQTCQYQVGRGANYIKVGDPISVISSIYPNYILDEDYVVARINSRTIKLDGGLVIKTNGTVITEIGLRLD